MCSSDRPCCSTDLIDLSDSGTVDWSALPKELVQEIGQKFTVLADYIYFRAVCVPWRSATSPRLRPLRKQSPWLMHSFEEDGVRCKFSCMDNNKNYMLQLPGVRERKCCGSSHGWMIFLEEKYGASLFNPLTQEHFKLPTTNVFPTVLDLWLEEAAEDVDWQAIYASRDLADSVLEKIVLSSSPTSGENTIALALVSERIAFCRLKDATWTLIEGYRGFFTDAIFHEGKFYVVDSSGGLLTVEIGLTPRVTQILPPLSDNDIQSYVVEVGGDIMMINRIRHVCDLERHIFGPTVAFEVYKLDHSGQQSEWAQLESLGSYSVFLGVNHSISFSSGDFPDLEEDSIYFTDDFCWSYNGEGDGDACIYNDLGFYNLKTKAISSLPCNIARSNFVYPTPKWVVPYI